MNNNTKKEMIDKALEYQVEFIQLQFTDIYGTLKNVAITVDELPRALDGKIMFDGSSIMGLMEVEESDLFLYPDPSTFTLFPWRPREGTMARMLCDIRDIDGQRSPGCTRSRLKNVLNSVKEKGFRMNMGPEAEFFLFYTDDRGYPTLKTHDQGSYFDLSPLDQGEDARRDIIITLQEMGIAVDSSHHESAPGQHEIDFHYSDPLTIADAIVTVRYVVKSIAQRHGLYATFMPKPLKDCNGSGMHIHQSMNREGENIFYDPVDERGLSALARSYMAGLLLHAPALTAITNPTINSYKRFVEGYNAPLYITWSGGNRTALLRIPSERGPYTRIELRSPDATCNPYLALGAIIASGIDGIEKDLIPPLESTGNLYQLSTEDVYRQGIKRLPYSLPQALDALEENDLLQRVLGESIWKNFNQMSREKWKEYQNEIHAWEQREYIYRY